MKKISNGISMFCLVLIICNVAQAQQKKDSITKLKEVMVVATKFPMDNQKIGKIVYKISEQELSRSKGKTVFEVLDNLAGVQINGVNSAPGKNKSTYIRGGRDRQLLVLIDGVPVIDPSGITNTFDLRLLTLSQIKSIEIMNGSASTLYGSSAATGVINITLKKASEKTVSVNYEVSGGTNNTQSSKTADLNDFNQNISFQGTKNKLSYTASFNAAQTGGLSEASDESSEVAYEKDDYTAINTYVNVAYRFSDKINLRLYQNYDKNVFDYDAGAFSDSNINNAITEQFRYGMSSNFGYTNGTFQVLASLQKTTRDFDSFNAWTNTTDSYVYEGITTTVDLINNYTISNRVNLLTGIYFQEQSNQTNTPFGNIDQSIANYTNTDPYITVLYTTNSGFNLNAGARLNMHSEYGNNWVYNLNPSFTISEKLKVLASYSTSFITPSIYQLFSQFGNVELEPETTKNMEIGAVFSKNEVFNVSSLFFYREESNTILLPDFVTYVNTNETIFAKGIETQVELTGIDFFDIKLGHTYVNKSADLDYIPKNKITAYVGYSGLKRTFISLQFKNISKRTYFDQWGSGSTINLDAYNLVDLFVNHSFLNKRFSVFCQMSNVFNENYIETIGFTTRGRNFKVGLNFKF